MKDVCYASDVNLKGLIDSRNGIFGCLISLISMLNLEPMKIDVVMLFEGVVGWLAGRCWLETLLIYVGFTSDNVFYIWSFDQLVALKGRKRGREFLKLYSEE